MTSTHDSTGLHLPHHDPSQRHVDQPRPALGDTVGITVELGDEPVEGAWLRTVTDGEQSWVPGTPDGQLLRFELPCTQDVVSYRFHLETASGPRWLTGGGLIDWEPTDATDFRLLTVGHAPAWVTEHVWYQVFPDRFATTGAHRADVDWATWSEWGDPIAEGPAAMTQLYGGDLDGVSAHLDHIASLGVGGIYLNPVFPARSNHRYDATTFSHVDPLLGGDAALARLADLASSRGIRVMTDLTLNHTGDNHEWFRAACADEASVEADFYHFIEHPHRYESWLGVDSLPKLDHRNDELRQRFYEGSDSVLARYLKPPFDMAGWRVDVANMTGRLGPIDLNHDVARTARRTVDAAGDRWLVGEHFFDASLDARGDGWHGTMNYAGLTRPIASWLGTFSALGAFQAGPGQPLRNGAQMARSMDAIRAAMPWQVTLASMGLLASHDTARWRTMARDDDAALVGVGLLMTLPGAPLFLYGDEVGLTGDSSERARRTMPWDPATWDQTFLDRYRALIGLRSRHEALQTGGFRWVHTAADEVVYLRETEDERLLIRAARAAAAPLQIQLAQLRAEQTDPLFDAPELRPDAGVVTLPGDGPAFSVWQLA